MAISVLVMAAAAGLAFILKGLPETGGHGALRGEGESSSKRRFAPSKAGAYLDMSPEQKVDAVRKTMRRLTSGAASSLGSVKDEVALLADDPAVIKAILEAHASRGELSRFEGAAFGDIFERIKHPRFVEPVIRMFSSPWPDVRNKAIRAAATQGDARLVPYLDRIYDEARAGGAESAAGARERVIYAAEMCGGDLLPGLLSKGLSDPAINVRSYSVDVIGRKKVLSFRTHLRGLTAAKDTHLRMTAAMALARLGDPRGLDCLLEMLDPRAPKVAQDAAAAIRELRLVEAVPTMKSLLENVTLELRPAIAGTLVVLGDLEVLAAMAAELRHANDMQRLTAITAVAASGAAEWHDELVAAIEREGPRCHEGVSLGLTWAPHPDPKLVRRLIRESPRPDLLIDIVLRIGDEMVPWLKGELHAARTEPRVLGLVAMLARLRTPAAREALITSRTVHPRLVEEGIRMLDLRCRRLGEKF